LICEYNGVNSKEAIMTKAELKLLERVFAKEITGNILQSKNKRYRALEDRGYVKKIKLKTLVFCSGWMPLIIKGWALTIRGHIAYCESCK
jgi:hypothetical protein